jgi:hypothetical protein
MHLLTDTHHYLPSEMWACVMGRAEVLEGNPLHHSTHLARDVAVDMVKPKPATDLAGS